MAGKREIKTTLALDGEQKFKKAMSDAASAIKELSSEQKLAEAQFEATGDAEQYAAEKTRILKSKIEEQQKVVKAAEDAVKAMKDKGVEPNSKAMVTWRTKVNQAKTSLTNMQTQLDRTESELSEQGTALDNASTDAGEYRDAIDKAASAVDFTATITAIDNVRTTIGTIITTAGRAAKAMINLERGAAGWADELATNAAVAGMDVVEYQGWEYASQMIDSSVDSIRGAYKRLNSNLDEPTDDILLSLNELKVANLELGGSARDTMDVFWDIIDAMGQVENTSRRDQLAMELFGKSYDDLLPLINAGSKAYKDFIEEGKQTAVSEENIKKLTDLDDTIVKLQATFDQTKYSLLAELAPAFQAAAEAATAALGAFNEFLDSEEGQESLAGLRDAISGIGEKVASVDWKNAMSRASSIIKNISNGLAWLLNHSELVVGAIGSLAAAWVGLTVSKDVLSVLQLLNTIKWAQLARVAASGGASAAGAGAAGAGAAGAGAAQVGFRATAKAAATAFADAMMAAAPVALPAAVIGGTALINKGQREDYAREIAGINEAIQTATAGTDDAKLREIAEEAERIRAALSDSQGRPMEGIVDELQELQNVDLDDVLTEDTAKRWQRFMSPENDLDMGEVQQVLQDVLVDMEHFVTTGESTGVKFASNYAKGIEEGEGVVKDASATLADAAVQAVESNVQPPKGLKTDFGKRFAAEIIDGATAAEATAKIIKDLPLMQKITGILSSNSPRGAYSRQIGGINEAIQAATAGTDDAKLRGIAVEAERIRAALTESQGRPMEGIVEELKQLQNIDLDGVLTENTAKRWQRFLSPENDLDMGEVQQLLQDVLADMSTFVSGAQTSGGEAISEMAAAMDAQADAPVESAATIAESTGDKLGSVDSETIGYNIPAGLASGIYEGYDLAVGAAEALGLAVGSRLRRVLEVRSPSKVMERIGKFVDMGFAKGIEDNVGAVERATGRMAMATMGRAISAQPTAKSRRKSEEMVHQTWVLDGKIIADGIVPYVDGIFSAKVARRR